MDKSVPKKIYLQWCDEDGEIIDIDSGGEVCWCEDKINCTDEEYIHVSEFERLKEEIEDALVESCKYFDCSYREAIKGE